MQVTILRLVKDPKLPSRGVLLIDGEPKLVTLELPWLDNAKNVSCIPEGSYRCTRTINRTTSGGMVIPETFQVTLVPKREGILFHVGNTASDSQGCILLGESFAKYQGKPAIVSSKFAFAKFLDWLKWRDEFELVIKHVA